jgi:hypothetical protein
VTVYVVNLYYPNAVYTYHVSGDARTVIACGGTSTAGSGGGQITTGPTAAPGNTTVTNPANPNSSYRSATCPANFVGYAAPRLYVGALGQVEAGGVNNIIRQNYGRSSQPTGAEMPPGSTFTVVGGPECTGASLNEAILWWQVTYNGTTGWTAESLNGEYFLQLIGTAPAQPTTAPNIGALAGQALAGRVLPPSLTLPSTPRNAISVANIAQIRPLNAEMTFPDSIQRINVTRSGLVSVYSRGMSGANSILFYENIATPQFNNAGEQLLTLLQNFWGLNPDGNNYLVTDSVAPNNYSLNIVNRSTGASQAVPLPGQVLDANYSPSGRYAVFIFSATGNTSNVAVYNFVTGTLNTVPVTNPASDAAFSANDNLLVTVHYNGQINYWFPETLFSGPASNTGLSGPNLFIGVSPDGKFVAVGGESGVVQLWNATTNTKVFDLPIFTPTLDQPGVVKALAFSPDGAMLATGKLGFPLGNNVLIFNTATGQQIATLQGMQVVVGLEFSALGDLLVGHDDTALHFWSVTP